jgi:hypothetical protein
MRSSRLIVACLALLLGAASCGGGDHAGSAQPGDTSPGTTPDGTGATTGTGKLPGGGTSDPLACSDLFDQKKLNTYDVEISDDEWSKMATEFANIDAILMGVEAQQYHPITFRLGGETVTNAVIRLKGQSSWVQTVQFDQPHPKMQFIVSFDQADANGQFHGVTKLHFDMPRSDWTFMHERLANGWLRQIGIMAPCASDGRLNINGQYYGLYVTKEGVGHRLIKQFFPGNPDGDLYDAGLQVETNRAMPNLARLDQFWKATDITSMTSIIDLSHSVLSWGAEVVLNDADGYYGGSHNFYIYDQGAPGYVFLPADTDSTFDWLGTFQGRPFDDHPLFWWEGLDLPQPVAQHYLTVIQDPTWRARYADAIATQLDRWNVGEMQGRIDAYAAQIKDAVAADPRKWATTDDFHTAVALARDVVAKRADFLRRFVACEHGNAAGDDQDGDGVKWCDECRDDNPAIHPGAAEVCGNMIDDNCNGSIDEGCQPHM